MADFDIEALIAMLAEAQPTTAVVTLRIEDAPETDEGQLVQGRYLDLDDALRERFRVSLRRAIARVRNWPIEEYEAGWVSIDDKLADASIDEVAGPLLPAIRAALTSEVARDFDARHEADANAAQLDDANATATDAVELVVGAYAVVFRPPNAEPAWFFRRRDPVERLDRNQFIARLQATRLTKVDNVFIFDSGFDAVLFRDRVLIKNSSAFEAMFLSDSNRKRQAHRALETLSRQVTILDEDVLQRVIDDDSRFAGRLRAIERRGALDQFDLEAVRRASDRFGITHRMLSGERLTFVPSWRFLWLAALEDSLVESAGTGRLSVARIKNEWRRREVKCVERDAAGNLTALAGDWGRAESRIVIRRLRSGAETYYSELADGRAEWDLTDEPKPRLTLLLGEGTADRSPDVPTCPVPAAGGSD